jgi:tocopherol cyclase
MLDNDGNRPYFEGWYLRLVSKETKDSLAFVFHVFDPHLPSSPRRGVGLQFYLSPAISSQSNITTTTTALVLEENSDLYRFRASSKQLYVRNLFRRSNAFEMTPHFVTGRVSNDDDTMIASFDFDLRPTIGWGGSDRQYSTTGWLAAIPFAFDPNYQVLVSQGCATGSVVITAKNNDKDQTETTIMHNFTDASLYLEKNWGSSFPSAWWWIQANSFASEDLCVTATACLRRQFPLLPFGEGEEEVGLVALHWNGNFYPFPFCHWDVQWGTWIVHGEFEDLRVRITGACKEDHGFPVLCPTQFGMKENAFETLQGTLRVELMRSNGKVVLNTTTEHAALEVGGLPWQNPRWKGESMTNGPLKSIILNRNFEEAGASFLDIVNQFVNVPGL